MVEREGIGGGTKRGKSFAHLGRRWINGHDVWGGKKAEAVRSSQCNLLVETSSSDKGGREKDTNTLIEEGGRREGHSSRELQKVGSNSSLPVGGENGGGKRG